MQKHLKMVPILVNMLFRSDSRLAPSQWETSLQSNAVSHWLGANLESDLLFMIVAGKRHVAHLLSGVVVLTHYGLVSPYGSIDLH